MAVKFPLEVKNGVKARNILELRENFDAEKVVGYFLDGKLKNWLDARYYEEEAEAVEQLDESDPELAKKLCEIFDAEYEEKAEIDTEEIARRNERIARLKQFTDDEEIINNIDSVAFDQEELADLYDKNVEKIYLCEGEFRIPKSKCELEYIIVGTPVIKGILKKHLSESPCENSDHIEDHFRNEITHKLDENCINEKLADMICWNDYVITNECVVFSNDKYSFKDNLPQLTRDDSYSEDYNYFRMWNATTKMISAFHIKDYEEYNRLVGATGNKIVLKKYFGGNDVNVYDLDTKKCKLLCDNWIGKERTLSVACGKIAYVDNNKNLYYVELENYNKVFVDNLGDTDNCVLVNENALIYIKEKKLYRYDFVGQKISVIQNIGDDVETLMAHNDMLYVINVGRNLGSDDNYVIISAINLKEPEKKAKEVFKEHVDSWEKELLQRDPYFILLKKESGYPVYAFNSTSGKVKKVMSDCGYTESESHWFSRTDYFHWGYSFSVVGNYFFYNKSKNSLDRNYHRVNMITGEVAVEQNV